MNSMQTENSRAAGSELGVGIASDRVMAPEQNGQSVRGGRGSHGMSANPPGRRRKSPALAAVLSLMPGLGQVYVGYYMRGFINMIVVASTITLVANTAGDAMEGEAVRGALEIAPLLGLFLSFYWLYNMIDAWRIANLYNEALLSADRRDLAVELPLPNAGSSLAGGVVLVAFGLLLLLNTMFDVPLGWLRDWWPLAPIGFGAYLIVQGVRDRKRRGQRN